MSPSVRACGVADRGGHLEAAWLAFSGFGAGWAARTSLRDRARPPGGRPHPARPRLPIVRPLPGPTSRPAPCRAGRTRTWPPQGLRAGFLAGPRVGPRVVSWLQRPKSRPAKWIVHPRGTAQQVRGEWGRRPGLAERRAPLCPHLGVRDPVDVVVPEPMSVCLCVSRGWWACWVVALLARSRLRRRGEIPFYQLRVVSGRWTPGLRATACAGHRPTCQQRSQKSPSVFSGSVYTPHTWQGPPACVPVHLATALDC